MRMHGITVERFIFHTNRQQAATKIIIINAIDRLRGFSPCFFFLSFLFFFIQVENYGFPIVFLLSSTFVASSLIYIGRYSMNESMQVQTIFSKKWFVSCSPESYGNELSDSAQNENVAGNKKMLWIRKISLMKHCDWVQGNGLHFQKMFVDIFTRCQNTISNNGSSIAALIVCRNSISSPQSGLGPTRRVLWSMKIIFYGNSGAFASLPVLQQKRRGRERNRERKREKEHRLMQNSVIKIIIISI